MMEFWVKYWCVGTNVARRSTVLISPNYLQAPDGTKNVPVGKVIALLAEEGDDISNLEAPKEDGQPPQQAKQPEQAPPAPPPPPPSAPSAPAPESSSHSPSDRVFPSVLRLLQANNIAGPDADKIKGTGVRGMLTKGDVLTYLGKASGPLGSFQAALDQETEKAKVEKTVAPKKPEEPEALDGAALRRLIVGNMLEASQKAYKPGTRLLHRQRSENSLILSNSSYATSHLRRYHRRLPATAEEDCAIATSRKLSESRESPCERVRWPHLMDLLDPLCIVIWIYHRSPYFHVSGDAFTRQFRQEPGTEGMSVTTR